MPTNSSRFKQRIDDPARHWKISEGDYAERPYWDAYTSAFEDALGKCSAEHAPWFITPSNHKWFRNLAIATIVSETLESLHMSFPEPTVDMAEIASKYHAIAEQADLEDPVSSADLGCDRVKGKKQKKKARNHK